MLWKILEINFKIKNKIGLLRNKNLKDKYKN
jgi:hypothetical protein